MKRYVLTGAPGAGKTSLLRLLETRGHAVVEEAASDVIALAQAQGVPAPWTDPAFVDAVAGLQRRREARASACTDRIVLFDRSPICTWALAVFLGYEPSAGLLAEIERIEREGIYQRRVFFVRNLGFVTPTEARRISFEEALRFEAVHAEAYRRFGYDCVPVEAAGLEERAAVIEREIGLASGLPAGAAVGGGAYRDMC